MEYYQLRGPKLIFAKNRRRAVSKYPVTANSPNERRKQVNGEEPTGAAKRPTVIRKMSLELFLEISSE
jgi:hypothetical protein